MKTPPRLRDLRLRLEYAAVRTIAALAGLMPLRLAVRWSAASWRVLAPRLNPKRHRIALENLAIAFPEKSQSERLAICMAHWENLGRVIAETVQDRVLGDPSRIEIHDRSLLARYRNKLGPAIGVNNETSRRCTTRRPESLAILINGMLSLAGHSRHSA